MTETTKKMNDWPPVCLASGSPQRRAILEELGIPYRLLAVDVEEIAAATPRETVEENAGHKLLAGLRIADRGAVVIAADTVLEVQGRLLGKPADETMAVQYLQMLSGGTATAYSAVAVGARDLSPVRAGAASGCLATETAEVHFKALPPEVIQWYVSTGEPMGRAGAFGISRLGEVLTESIDGCHSCVAGLPKTALLLALARLRPEGPPPSRTGAAHPGGRAGEAGANDDSPVLRRIPAGLVGTRVQLRALTIGPFGVPA